MLIVLPSWASLKMLIFLLLLVRLWTFLMFLKMTSMGCILTKCVLNFCFFLVVNWTVCLPKEKRKRKKRVVYGNKFYHFYIILYYSQVTSQLDQVLAPKKKMLSTRFFIDDKFFIFKKKKKTYPWHWQLVIIIIYHLHINNNVRVVKKLNQATWKLYLYSEMRATMRWWTV